MAGPRDDFRKAVDGLTQHSKLRREYAVLNTRGTARKVVEHFTGPSLLQELIEAIEPSPDSMGRGSFASRPPIDPDALDLWIEVAFDTHFWAKELKINRGKYQGKEGVPRLLRSVSATAPGKWTDVQFVAGADLCQRWIRNIRTMLHNQREWRGVRGAQCDQCQAVWILEKRVTSFNCNCKQKKRPHAHVEHYREPAITVVSNPDTGALRSWKCRSCEYETWLSQPAVEAV